MPHCPDCASEVEDGRRHCSQCGAPVYTLGRGATDEPSVSTDSDATTTEPTDTGRTPPSRRRFLKIGGGVTGAALLGGAGYRLSTGGGGPAHDHAQDPWKNENRDRATYRRQVSGDAVLPSGRYGVRTADFRGSVYLTITAEADQRFDIFTMSADRYGEQYQEGKPEFYYQTALSATETTSFRVQRLVSADDYRVVFDNTGVYGASPSGDVTVSFMLHVSVPAPVFFDFRSALEAEDVAYSRVGVTSDRAFWGVAYPASLAGSERENVIVTALRLYAEHVPEPDGRHQGLRLGTDPFTQKGVYATVLPDVARLFRADRIGKAEYIRRVFGGNLNQ